MPTTSDMELFEESLEANIYFINDNICWLETPSDKKIADGICKYYDTNGFISRKQKEIACRLWQTINSKKE